MNEDSLHTLKTISLKPTPRNSIYDNIVYCYYRITDIHSTYKDIKSSQESDKWQRAIEETAAHKDNATFELPYYLTIDSVVEGEIGTKHNTWRKDTLKFLKSFIKKHSYPQI